MESTTQPILCCLGETVAGLPTQFLMERAFAAHHLDWRAITVEVAADRFDVAVEGMQAMRFMALRIFPTLEKVAAKRFFEENSIGDFVGSATSAFRTDDGWEVWNNCGISILNLLAQRNPLEQSIVWLHGNSVRTRSTLASLSTGKASPASVIWTEAGGFDIDNIPPGVLDFGGDQASILKVCESTQSVAEQLDGVLAAHEGPRELALTMIAESLDAKTTQLAIEIFDGLNVETNGIISKLDTAVPSTVFTIDNPQVAIAAEAYDFERWTGVKVDQGALRDAYDEYCDF